jgi:hypothetical protein
MSEETVSCAENEVLSLSTTTKPLPYGKWREAVLGQKINTLSQLRRWNKEEMHQMIMLAPRKFSEFPEKYESYVTKLEQQHKEVLAKHDVQILESIEEEKRIESEHPPEPSDEDVERLTEKVNKVVFEVADVTEVKNKKYKGNSAVCFHKGKPAWHWIMTTAGKATGAVIGWYVAKHLLNAVCFLIIR